MVSWGESCGTPYSVGVYVKVVNFVDWMDRIISGDGVPTWDPDTTTWGPTWTDYTRTFTSTEPTESTHIPNEGMLPTEYYCDGNK